MGEMENPGLQAAVTPFVADGSDPIVDGSALRSIPCSLDGTEFKVTGDEDERSIAISKAANAGAASVRGRARAAQAGTMTLGEAEAAGLVEVVREPRRTVFVTSAPVTVRIGGSGTTQVTPITGEGKRGEARVYDGPVEVTAKGAATQASVAGRAADAQAPRTTAKRRGGKLTLKAKDASGVAVTMVKVGKAAARPYRKPMKVGRRTIVRYWSVDTWGNAEKARVSKTG
jgi:hypothetical protein